MKGWIDSTLFDLEWEDCSIGFTCTCGYEKIVDSQDEYSECECGRKYRLITKIQMKDVNNV